MPGGGERIIFEPGLIKIAAGLVLVLFSFFAYRRTWPPLPLFRRMLLASLRATGFILLLLFILDPALVASRRESRKPVIPVLLDVSRSMRIPDEGGKTRREAAISSLVLLRERLVTQADLPILPFSGEIHPLTVEMDSIPEAEAEGTDILGSLDQAIRRYRSQNLAAVILLTDGRVTRGMTSSGELMSPRIFIAAWGDTLEGRDLSIADVIYERIAYAGTRIDIKTIIRTSGLAAGATVRVELLENGEIRDGRNLPAPAGSGEVEAVLHYLPEEMGDLRLTVRVAPVEAEITGENNLERIRLTVLKDKLRLLYIDQFPDWNMTFIRDLMADSKRFRVDPVTWSARDGWHHLPDRGTWNFPTHLSGLEDYDLVIIADDTRIFTESAAVKILERYLREGGGLLFLADENSPLRTEGAVALLEDFLPLRRVSKLDIVPGEFFVEINRGGGAPRFAAVMEERGVLERLPPLLARLSGMEATAAAEIPLVLVSPEENSPFLAVQRYPKGVSAVLLGLPLWRWKLAEDEGAAYRAFITSLVQYLAEGMDIPALQLQADRSVYRTGDRPRISIFKADGGASAGIKGELYWRREKEEILLRTFNFRMDRGRRDFQRAVLEPLPAGEYVVRARLLNGSGGEDRAEMEFSVQDVSVEFIRTSCDIKFLRRLAGNSGGKLLNGDDLDNIGTLIKPEVDRIEKIEIRALRETFLLFLGIMLFFAAEWILRKTWGLI
ncbi:MAG: hypothetical protein JXB45_04755 [Candidatus Krumholzibacteriota bacterium]|nr:hypothetical protein [Candidatus Krumholzibacteriota bacterium]